MRNTIIEAEKNVERAMTGLAKIAKSSDEDTRRLSDVEKELWTLLLALGRSLIALFLARRAARRRPGFYEYEQKRYFVAKDNTRFLSDGSEHILERQRRFFPDAIPCLDWCHATEYLWKACTAFRREGTKQLKKTAEWLKKRMLSGDIDGVIAYLEYKLGGISKTGPGNKGKREKLSKTISYLDNNKERLRYKESREAGLPIGSGVVEGTIRNLIRQRLDCSGMRWGLDRCEHILHLRCVFLNQQWDMFGTYLERKNIRLASQPQPATPYDAKPMYSKSA